MNSKKKLFIILLLSAFTLPMISYAQKPVVDHIAFCSKNLKKSLAFYTQVMHLQPVANPFNDTLHVWYNIGNNVKLHVIQGDCNETHQKADHLCFMVPSVKEFARMLKRMNIPYSNWKGDSDQPTLRPDGILQIYLQDPDGYWIEIDSPVEK